MAADDFASRFAVPCNRLIEADHRFKMKPEWAWLRQSNDRRPRQSERPRSKDDVRVFKPMTLNEPVAKIARALKRTMERPVKRLNVIGLSLKLAREKRASAKKG